MRTPARLPGLLLVLAFAPALSPCAADPATPLPDSGTLLVANKGDRTLSIVDLSTGRQVAAVDEQGETGHEVAVSPDGRRAFVPIYSNVGVGQKGADGSLIRVIDIGSRAIVATIDFGRGVRPHCPVFGPRNGLLYVTTELEKSITVIDPATLKVVATIPTGEPQSHMFAISHDGARGYTANVNTGTVSVLDLVADRLVATIPVDVLTQRISVSMDDRRVFTADQTKYRLVVIDAATDTVSGSIPLPGLGFGTAPTPDGRSLLVALPGIDMLGIVDLAQMRVVRTLDLPKAPQEIRVRGDGLVAYVSCDASRQVAVVNLRDWKIDRLIDVGRIDDGLALIPGD